MRSKIEYGEYDLEGLHRQHGSQREVCRQMNWAQGGLSGWLLRPENRELRAACIQAVAEFHAGNKRPAPVPVIEGAGPDVEVDIAAVREAAERRYAAKADRSEEKLTQTIQFPEGPVALFIISDQHLGNEGTDVRRVFEEQEIVNATPGAYVWQNGDGVDSFVIGKLIKENWNPSLPVFEQWSLWKHYLHGFEGKLVAYNAGNHEGFIPMVMGIDYARDICPDGILYDSDEISVTVHVGEQEFRLLSRHKWAGSSIYSQTHGQERAARFSDPDYDVYIGSHKHAGAVAREFTVGNVRKIAIQTGTYKTHDSFARKRGFAKSDSSTAAALVMHDTGSFWATSDIKAVLEYMEAVYGRNGV